MISINKYINNLKFSTNVKKQQNIARNYSNEVLKEDSFKKKSVFKNKRILAALIFSSVVLIAAMVKRKQITGLFSSIFKRNAQINTNNINTKTTPEIISQNQKLSEKVETIVEEIKKAEQKKIQYAKDVLIKNVNDGALAGGIGFYGPKSIAKEEALENFINDLSNNNYKIVRIPTINEATSTEIETSIYETIKQAENEFKTTGKRTALIIRDLDIIGAKRSNTTKYVNIVDELLNTENCKERGFAWVWDAGDINGIDKALTKRTAEIALISPCEQDNPETINQFIDYVNMRNFGQEYKNKFVEYAKKILENKT